MLHKLSIILLRTFKILFKRKRGIEKIYFNYGTKHLFNNSYIFFNYQFKNAIYYQFGNLRTLESNLKIYDPSHFSSTIQVTVYGLFKKEKFGIKIKPEFELVNQNFKTFTSNLNLKLESREISLTKRDLSCIVHKINVAPPKIKIKNRTLIFTPTTYNQTDFL